MFDEILKMLGLKQATVEDGKTNLEVTEEQLKNANTQATGLLDAQNKLNVAVATGEELQTKLAETSAANAELKEQNTALAEQVAQLTAENVELKKDPAANHSNLKHDKDHQGGNGGNLTVVSDNASFEDNMAAVAAKYGM